MTKQLIGQMCNLCGHKIGSVLDGDFCTDCDQPSHFLCRKPALDAPCPTCGGDQRASSSTDSNQQALEVDDCDLELWNPRVAALWSLLFSPLFGAAIHAINWRHLKNPHLALANRIWVIGMLMLLAVSPILALFPESEFIAAASRALGPALVAGWYFSLGIRQDQHVRETLEGTYNRRSWAVPLLIAFLALACYFLTVFAFLLFILPE